MIGAGMAGTSAANTCASAGWKVAIVDVLPYGIEMWRSTTVTSGRTSAPSSDGSASRLRLAA